MKHRITAGVLLTLLLLIPIGLCLAGFFLPAQYTETFVGVLPDKLERLRNADSPRLILVGGSSVPFSVRSDLLEEALPGYSVVDFGLYAQLGTPFMLDLLEEELRPGDIVIISPEQDEDALSTRFSAESVWQASDGHFSVLPQISSDHYEKLAAAFPAFAGKKIRYALCGSPTPTDIYARYSFNAYGDIESPLRTANIMAGGYDPNQMIRFSPEILTEEFIQWLNNFAVLAREIGAEVYYRFPPMNQAAIDANEQQIHQYYDTLNTMLSFPILGDPNRSILDKGWFYDTNFHLNASGAVVFTKGLIEDLKILMGDTSVTAISLPSIPGLAVPLVIAGDNSDADCFTYSKTEEGWIIDGLTEAGQNADTLIIPVSHEDLPVIGLAESLFVGNATIHQVTVQTNIRVLYDGMFRGCTSLQELILIGSDPSGYTVGDALFDGADFLIYVPDEALDTYRRHYSWQQYGSFLLPFSP